MNKNEVFQKYLKNQIDIFSVIEFFDTQSIDLNKQGVVYTPQKITQQMVKKINPKIHEKIIEFSVGHGSFIFAILDFFKAKYSSKEIIYFIENNLFAHDIIESSILEFKELLSLYCQKEFNTTNIILTNISVKNSLEYITQDISFDLSIGNPPFVKFQNLDQSDRNFLITNFNSCKNGNIDLYFAFLELAQRKSKRSIHIVQNGFLRNKSAKTLRNLLLDDVSFIKDFQTEQLFKQVSTYSVIVGLSKDSKIIEYESNNKTTKVQKTLLLNKEWNLNGIEQVNEYQTQQNKIHDIAYVYSGIETLANHLFIHKGLIVDGYLIINDSHKIEANLLKKYIKVSKIKKTEDIIQHTYNIIYPYNQDGSIIKEAYLKKTFPFAYKYLLSIKPQLKQRDKGKNDHYDAWYAYGRKQGFPIKYKGKVIMIPTLINSKSSFIELDHSEEFLIGSGFFLLPKNELQFSKIFNELNNNRFTHYTQLTGKIWPGSTNDHFYSTNKKNILDFSFN